VSFSNVLRDDNHMNDRFAEQGVTLWPGFNFLGFFFLLESSSGSIHPIFMASLLLFLEAIIVAF
jgi:hypothetical protein